MAVPTLFQWISIGTWQDTHPTRWDETGSWVQEWIEILTIVLKHFYHKLSWLHLLFDFAKFTELLNLKEFYSFLVSYFKTTFLWILKKIYHRVSKTNTFNQTLCSCDVLWKGWGEPPMVKSNSTPLQSLLDQFPLNLNRFPRSSNFLIFFYLWVDKLLYELVVKSVF